MCSLKPTVRLQKPLNNEGPTTILRTVYSIIYTTQKSNHLNKIYYLLFNFLVYASVPEIERCTYC